MISAEEAFDLGVQELLVRTDSHIRSNLSDGFITVGINNDIGRSVKKILEGSGYYTWVVAGDIKASWGNKKDVS